MSGHVEARHRAGRLKQWFNYLRKAYPEGQKAFDAVRLMRDARQLQAWLSEQVGSGQSSTELALASQSDA